MKTTPLLVAALAISLTLHAAEPTAEETRELMTNKSLHPSEVTLVKPAKLNVLREGVKTGEITLPAGRSVRVTAVTDSQLSVAMDSSEGRVPLADTDFLKRCQTKRQEQDKRSVAERRAKLISESPGGTPPPTAPQPARTLPPALPVPIPPTPDKIIPPIETPPVPENRQKIILEKLTAVPFKCMENGNMIGNCTFSADGNFLFDGGIKGKWKLEKNGELVTLCKHNGKERVNRYVYEDANGKFIGKRDRKSDIQDGATLLMMPSDRY